MKKNERNKLVYIGIPVIIIVAAVIGYMLYSSNTPTDNSSTTTTTITSGQTTTAIQLTDYNTLSEKINEVLTADEHFKQAGFKILL